ncbi:SAM-dependent methyltransferase [Lichenifustis flavocetrariae]|uniref:SAM-dependent methyltransferase n=1 Tax=Lichenifustis flavocetrariae TaxID=2949735 RepID=A0AA41Z2G3_9HYPH|nr:SAM-dependent methyltransferase [Lichenifustis flavocetrariae]MCW6509130.1 SAM-dependent methyltransferase [Lichenifustis flavocetrariae]
MTAANSDLRAGEQIADLPASSDASVYFLGRLRTPWSERSQCPRRGDAETGPLCRVELDPRWREALAGLHRLRHLEILYWMHLARRDLVMQNPKSRGELFGTFALRSPMRPNPISSSVVTLVSIEAEGLVVRGLDCIDGTPLIDIKPMHCPMWPEHQDAVGRL